MAGQPWHGEIVNKRRDGSLYTEEMTVTPVQDEQGQPTRFIAIKQDITERAQAAAQIRESLRVKEILLKEIHHRVKNNMQIIISLLNLQADYIHDPPARELFRESQDRIRSMALVHEKLYQSPDLAQVDFSEYIYSLGASLFRSTHADADAIAFTTQVDNVRLGIDQAIPCGLIINELLINCLKHAFPAGAPLPPWRTAAQPKQIRVEFYRTAEQYVLIISDNGVGLPAGMDWRATESLGMQLVVGLVSQLSGVLQVDSSAGASFKITFPAS
jgi:two-component sensor histidine kinase